jgi:hypothetical protein
MRFSSSFLLTVAACWCAPLSMQAQSSGQVRLVTPHAMSNHVFNANLYAPLGRTYEIDASTNFQNWSSVASGIVADSVPFVDGNSPGFPRRYYRASLDWTIMLPNTYLLFATNSGIDGRLIAYPYNWITNQGTDGRLIGYPPGWNTNQGVDGRLIAYPSGWSTVKGPDGRLVAFPTNGCTTVTNADGRITVHPTSGVAGLGPNSYEAADWKLATGGDGRQVAFPVSNFPTNQGGDGRLVAYVATGWSTVHGPDGRTVAYPVAEFSTNASISGRTIVFPSSGWVTVQGIDGRTIAYPAIGTGTIELDFEDEQLFAFIGHLRTVLADPDFGNFLIYTYFGTGEQRFAD